MHTNYRNGTAISSWEVKTPGATALEKKKETARVIEHALDQLKQDTKNYDTSGIGRREIAVAIPGADAEVYEVQDYRCDIVKADKVTDVFQHIIDVKHLRFRVASTNSDVKCSKCDYTAISALGGLHNDLICTKWAEKTSTSMRRLLNRDPGYKHLGSYGGLPPSGVCPQGSRQLSVSQKRQMDQCLFYRAFEVATPKANKVVKKKLEAYYIQPSYDNPMNVVGIETFEQLVRFWREQLRHEYWAQVTDKQFKNVLIDEWKSETNADGAIFIEGSAVLVNKSLVEQDSIGDYWIRCTDSSPHVPWNRCRVEPDAGGQVRVQVFSTNPWSGDAVEQFETYSRLRDTTRYHVHYRGQSWHTTFLSRMFCSPAVGSPFLKKFIVRWGQVKTGEPVPWHFQDRLPTVTPDLLPDYDRLIPTIQKLNVDQRRAVNLVLCSEEPIVIINGPPESGKTLVQPFLLKAFLLIRDNVDSEHDQHLRQPFPSSTNPSQYQQSTITDRASSISGGDDCDYDYGDSEDDDEDESNPISEEDLLKIIDFQ
ncbi:hypothetical protein HDU85_005935 [Gaertneriomyces sp. JEL0708]|nr:hypothetical protein HDU85_005935 [Gaertneriomyces sp. JEL0708]